MNLKNRIESEHHSDFSKITKGAGITLGGNIAGKTLLFFYTLFLAKVLGVESLGYYFLGITVTRLLTIVSTLGLDTGVVRYVAIYKGTDDIQRMKDTVLVSAGIAMIPSLIVVILTFYLGDFIATSIFHKPVLGNVIKLFAIGIPFEALMKIFLASTRGLKHMQYVSITENIFWIASRFLFAFVFIFWMDMGLKGAVLAYVVSSIIASIMSFYYANKLIPLFAQKMRPLLTIKTLLKFSIPMAFTVLLHDLMIYTDILMLGFFVSASNVGIYSIVARIVTMAQVFCMAFQPIFQPFVADLYNRKEIERLTNILKSLTQWVITINFPVFISLVFYPEFFLQIFGKEFVDGAGCLSILVVAFAVSSISYLPASMIFMTGRSDLSLKNNLAVLIISVILNLLLIPEYGIIGAAYATGISLTFLTFVRILEVYFIMKIHPFRLQMWKPLFAGTIFLLVFFHRITAYQSNTHIFFLLLLLFISYFILIYFLKLDEEQVYLFGIIKKKVISFFT